MTDLSLPDYPLRQLYFYLTEGCNLACRHCWLAPKFDPGAARYPALPAETFEAIIQEALPLGLEGVKLTGGEPLMHPQIADLLEILRRADLRLNIETNGLLCTPSLAAEIARCKAAFVSVSLDGADAAAHEWVRGVPGAFEAALQAVRNLAAAGLRPQVIFSVMRHNAHQLEAVTRLAVELGAGSVKYNLIQPTARGEKLHQADEVLSVKELIDLGRFVELELARVTPIRLFFSQPMAFRPLSQIWRNGGNNACGILNILGVLADGHYALCGIGENVPDLVFGRAGVDALAQVWLRNPTLQALRQGLPDRLTGVCTGCLMKAACRGECIAQNYYRSGSLWMPHWFCQAAEEQGLFPTSRLAR
jgi:SynChlorMet cassette radical SAM/SPASM protein ScmF